MVDVYIVTPIDSLGKDFLTQKGIETFRETKQRILGYAEADLRIPTGKAISLPSLPLGACRSQEEAEKLIQELATALPGKQFRIELKSNPDAEDVTWYGLPAE